LVKTLIELEVMEALGRVHDPEIPPLSITDLGIVERVHVTDATVEVELLPTFSGCPALDVIHEDVRRAVREVAGERDIRVSFVLSPPWTSDRITPAGREALKSYGLTPPGSGGAFVPLAGLQRPESGVPCPFCGSTDTFLESAYGPTLCRTTHFCRACRNPFEGFKTKQAPE
jgi:ring-1,2-phenylacetyl-CoA epoxidase subunit PaaD